MWILPRRRLIGEQGALVIALLGVDHAKPGKSPKMSWFELQNPGDITF